eukprot:4079894-Pyramimonas_sp.AAC.1
MSVLNPSVRPARARGGGRCTHKAHAGPSAIAPFAALTVQVRAHLGAVLVARGQPARKVAAVLLGHPVAKLVVRPRA